MAQNGSQAETMTSGVAGRYASALFELAQDQGAVDAVAADLDRFDALIRESADLQRLRAQPRVHGRGAGQGGRRHPGQGGHRRARGQFHPARRRQPAPVRLPDMVRAYRQRVAKAKGIVRAEVRVAEPPSERVSARSRRRCATSPRRRSTST